MYAIIETGGKQYKVSAGQSIEVEKIPASVGERVDISNVLLVADGGEVVVGKPTVEGAKVRATVVEQGRGRKITVFKFKSGNRYHRKRGHRQSYTRLRVESILRGGVEEVQSVETAAMEEREAAVAEVAVGRAEVSIEELGLSSRVVGVLRDGGIESVEDLLKTDEEELLAIRGFGAKSLEQVRASLKAKGFIKA
ncbi:MAG: 50S ribosomal protein L21 [Chloroflexi bacterium B3_Chlor]|nr:MAG: 50S ribosomal protein L21 [Chloroflexi bacterium B3_Chlor]